ncbi:hypothetical protein ABT288_33420 [Streptomyces sp. NPDC001093]|uniref:hypothetical protein n=1 Tax=Streptomyces sp. NPDC001093 TaxID=3154376 RepID=UPI0033319CA9
MHRTTTTAAILVTVAVSALSGCVTVPRPSPPAPPRDTAPSVPTAARPDGSAEPRAVQAPAQEALERTEPSRGPQRVTAATPATPATPHRPAEAPRVVHHPPAAPSAPARPRGRPRKSYTAAPDLPSAAPEASNVCALGRQYGGWRGDSPEAEICERTYGH